VQIIVRVILCLLMSCSVAFSAGPPPAKVVVAKVVTEDVAENQSVIGVLYYERTSEISTEVSGLVESIAINEGDQVKKGDVLVRLNTELLDREISLAKTRIEQIELRIQNAEKDYKRLEQLYQKSGVSEKSYDDAVFTYQDAVLEKQALEDNLQKLLIQKRRSVIVAPFTGVILRKNTDVGGWVQQGSTLVRLGSTNELYVRVPVAEDMLQFIGMKENVEVTINAFDRIVSGKVVNIDPVADVKTKNVFVKINIPHQPLVAENMSATVYLSSGPQRKLSILQRAALVKFQGKDFVYTVKEDKAAILPVTVVSYLGDRVAVSDPYIVPGMSVVVEGNERLRPDQPVTVAGEQ
jgi:membrane fusion protein, multidrug efflux system